MAQIDLQTARTELEDPEEAAEALVSQLEGAEPKLVTMFASRPRDQRALNVAIRRRLGDGVRFMGATSAQEIDGAGVHQGNVVLGAFSGSFEVGLGLGKSLSADAMTAGATAMKAACAELGTTPRDLDPRRAVGVVIDDGFQYKKEELLLGALDKNQGLLLVGSGASDPEEDPSKQSSEVHVDGEVAGDAVLVALIQTDVPFAALRHHAYHPTGQTLTITKVSDDGNRALEIDGKPAAKRYAEVLDVGVDELEFGLPKGFAQKPLALKVGREYFLRSPWKPLEDGSILFANLLEEDSVYELMLLGDMTAMTKEFLDGTIADRVKDPTAAMYFHCSGRHWFSSALGTSEELSEAFTHGPPAIGFNVFFEVYCGFHINTTLTAVAFGQS